MADVKYSDAKMYIIEPDGNYTPFIQIQGFDLSYADDFSTFPSISITNELSFKSVCKMSKEAVIAILGIRNAVINYCPNKRVVHLALYAKKARTRKKNFHRAIKILEV